MNRKRSAKSLVCAGASICGVAMTATEVSAQYVTVYGGSTYDQATQTGYQNPSLPFPSGSSADNGIAVVTAHKYTGGTDVGLRAVRWDASGGPAAELGTSSTESDGTTDCYAFAINTAGVAVGYARKYTGGTPLGRRAVRWDGSGTAATELGDLGTNSSGSTDSQALAVNTAGTAVGYAHKYSGGTLLGQRAVRWDTSGTAATELDNIGTRGDGYTDSSAGAINSAGTSVGWAVKYTGGMDEGDRAVRWDASGSAATELGNLGTASTGFTLSQALAINGAGIAIGGARKYTGGTYQGDRDVRWDASGSAATELGNLGTDSSGITATNTYAINTAGIAVGYARKYTGGTYQGDRAVRWDASGTAATELGNLGTGANSHAYDINGAGIAVGDDTGASFGGLRALVWRPDGTAVDLNTLIDPASGWYLHTAAGISDTNWVTGIGSFDPDGAGPLAAYDRAFLLDVSSAVPEPGSLALLAVADLALLRRRRRFGVRDTRRESRFGRSTNRHIVIAATHARHMRSASCRSARSRRLWLRAAAVLASACAPAMLRADPLDPGAFTSLGTLNVTSGSITIDTNALTLTGDATFTGVSHSQGAGNPEVAVFTFDNFNIDAGVTIKVVGRRALALLSQGSMNIDSPISLNGGYALHSAGGVGGAGGYDGARVIIADALHDGEGPGGGGGYSLSYYWDGGGGGYGGAGSPGLNVYSRRGASYGDLLSVLQGGSGGGGGSFFGPPYYSGGGGGGGGGAIELGAVGALTLGSAISCNGGGGFKEDVRGGSGGDGAGGGILLHAASVSFSSLSASGESRNNGTYFYNGGAGGGGRVAVCGGSFTGLQIASMNISVEGGENIENFYHFSEAEAGVLTLRPDQVTVQSGQSLNVGITGSQIYSWDPRIELFPKSLTVESGGSAAVVSALRLEALDVTGTLQLTFDADEWDSVISFAPGAPVTLGGTLDLEFADGVDVTGQLGRSFDLFDWSGVNPMGTFNVSSPYIWDLSKLYTTGEVTLEAVPEPGSLSLLAFAGLALLRRRRRRASNVTGPRDPAQSILTSAASVWCVATLGACVAIVSDVQGALITFGSDTSWNVSDSSNNPTGNAQFVVLNDIFPTRSPPGATSYGAVGGFGMLADLSAIPSAFWIWAPEITGDTPNPSFAEYTFSKQFELSGTPVSGTISIAVDDYAAVYVNGGLVGSVGSLSDNDVAFAAQSTLTTFDFTSMLSSGENTILIVAENGPFGDPSSYRGDPAGVVFGGSLASVPEPGSLSLLAVAGLAMLRRRRS